MKWKKPNKNTWCLWEGKNMFAEIIKYGKVYQALVWWYGVRYGDYKTLAEAKQAVEKDVAEMGLVSHV